MALSLYNSLKKKEEAFTPADPKNVTMYTCGPTVYGRPHIGNYSSFLMADLLRRWLEVGHGYTVTHVKNITDVGHLLHDADQGDDKVEKEAQKEKLHPLEIAKRYTDQYLEDESALNMIEPAHRPRASEFVEHMKEIINGLLEAKKAYITEDGIYFDVTSFPHYGALSGNTLENLSAGARVSVDEKKKHPADFALWKFCVGENAHHILRWASPGGVATEGFPGWHIECSAMSRALLGDQIDLHTGGEDNIFPHHECEIAQSESFTHKVPFVHTWVHKRRIDIALDPEGNDVQKMSKSLGNVLSIPDIVSHGYDPLDIRYLSLSVHYRTRLKFSWKGLDDSRIARRTIIEWMKRKGSGEFAPIVKPGQPLPEATADDIKKFEMNFDDAMNSDLNTPAALAAIFSCIHKMNTVVLPDVPTRDALARFISKIARTFGCFEWKEDEALSADLQAIIDERDRARIAKDFAESDRLRGEIEKRGFVVKDTKDGQKISKK